MSEPILVAVPNTSEGQDATLIGRLAHARPLLDVHSDPTHNRTVITFGGTPDDVVDASSTLLEHCVRTLDLRTHHGVHPRNGVLDVLPFVPFACTEDVARSAARRLAAAAAGFGLPVYFYERAADPVRALPDLRRALRRVDRPIPDVGPREPHPTAGVVCIAVRDPLIAFNVTVRAEATTLRQIASRLRALPDVRALAFPDQVSMNLVDPARTGPRSAFRAVQAAAADLGGDIGACEVVGLVPGYVLDELDGLPFAEPPKSIEAALSERGA